MMRCCPFVTNTNFDRSNAWHRLDRRSRSNLDIGASLVRESCLALKPLDLDLLSKIIQMSREFWREGMAEHLADATQWHAILRAARPGHAWLDRREVKIEDSVEHRLGRLIGAEEPLFLRIDLGQLN